jgi:regulator of sigma E protease
MALAAQSGPLDYFFLVAKLSVYLGLFNLLPVPALDGGRALVIAVASVLRRRVNPKVEANVHTVGLVVLLGLMIVVSIKDVVKGIFGHG